MSLSSLAIGASATVGKNSEEDANIIDFVEASWGLKMTLFPIQKIILKAHYGLELDGVETFKISDWRRQDWEEHTEKSYLKKLYDEGRCNIGEVIPGKQRREMILSIGRRSGKCVTGDTLIPTSRGLVRLDSLGDSSLGGLEYQPLSELILQEGGNTARTAFFYNGGIKKTKKMRTSSGFELEGTPNHRIKVLDSDFNISWKYLADIKEEDLACLNRKRGLFPDSCVSLVEYKSDLSMKDKLPDILNEDLAEFLGVLVGDGTWSSSSRVEVTVAEEGFKSDVCKKMVSLFGKVSVSSFSSGCYRVSCYSKELRLFLHRLGWGIQTPLLDKSIPHVILKSPRSVVCAFFRGLFETDGYIRGFNSVTKKHKREVVYYSSSPLLLKESQILLMNLGVLTTRRWKERKGKKNREGFISLKGSDSYLVFLRDIGFISQKKRDIAKALFDRLKVRVDHSDSSSPKGFGSFLKSRGVSIRSHSPSFAKLGQILKGDLSDDLREKILKILDLSYFFDKVISVEDSENHVYDLNVPEGSMFVGNCFTNHNTTISACIAAYETYKLIKKDDPQKYYGLPSSNNIQIISVATDKDQAGLLYQEVSGHYRNCAFFGPYTANNTLSYARFQTPSDVTKYGRYIENADAKATLKVTFRSCVAKGLRGAGNICVILDEVAHFTETGQSGAEEVYNAVVPSTSAYSPKDPINPTKPVGEVEGRIILISSPLGKQGLFYKLFNIGMQGGGASSNMLCVQAPTWEVNPTVPAEEFEKHYLKNAAVFFTEYGGKFTDRTRGWIEKEEDLLACVDPNLKERKRAPARKPHFIGIDLGLVGDGTAIAIGHLEEDKIVLDLVTQIKAGEGDFADRDRLDFDDVADWIFGYTRKFYVSEGLFDQWAGIPLEQALSKRGLGQMRSEHMTKNKTSDMYQNFKSLMWDKKISLYDNQNVEEKGHAPYILELFELQAHVHSKHVVTVEAPQVQGKHDDMADALIRMVWVASRNFGKQKYFANGSGGNTLSISGKGFATSPKLRGRANSSPQRSSPRNNKHSLRNRILGKRK